MKTGAVGKKGENFGGKKKIKGWKGKMLRNMSAEINEGKTVKILRKSEKQGKQEK